MPHSRQGTSGPDRRLLKAVTDVGGHYLDLADPIHGHPEYMADEADPNNEGYAAIAAAVGPSIQALLPSD